MKVLIVVDKYGSAIWRMAEAVKKHNPFLEIKVLPVHPKRNDVDTMIEAQASMLECDVIDVHYWKSGEILRTSFPKEFGDKPRVLFHFNPYDLDKQDWLKIYSKVVVVNTEMHEKIPYANLIPLGVDLETFPYIEKEAYTQERVVHMSVARIESKKGVLEVARACKELGYKLLLVGRVSEPAYMHEIASLGADLEFREAATEEALIESYRGSTVHVCNSVDSFESGTLPILEAMASGVPVLSRNIGHVPDLYNGSNLVVRSGAKDDMVELTKNLKELVENREWRLKLRDKAWETIKSRDVRRMARQVSSVYYSVWKGERPLVSVVVPTHDRPESLIECLAHIATQDYGKIEVVVCDSGLVNMQVIVDEYRKRVSFPVKYIRFSDSGYTLAQARNRAVIEAQGELLVFCDDRLAMEPITITKFAESTYNKLWQWGVKDNFEKSFVENLSCVNRADFISGGMFNERIEWYGGMTQEIRTRYELRQGFVFELNKEARAMSIKRTGSKSSRRKDIVESKFTLFKMYDS